MKFKEFKQLIQQLEEMNEGTFLDNFEIVIKEEYRNKEIDIKAIYRGTKKGASIHQFIVIEI